MGYIAPNTRGRYYKGQGGRPKGAKGKRTDLHALCEKHGINVFEAMITLAMSEQDPDKQFNKYKECAAYLYSKPKEELDLSKFTPQEIREYVLTIVKPETA